MWRRARLQSPSQRLVFDRGTNYSRWFGRRCFAYLFGSDISIRAALLPMISSARGIVERDVQSRNQMPST